MNVQRVMRHEQEDDEFYIRGQQRHVVLWVLYRYICVFGAFGIRLPESRVEQEREYRRMWCIRRRRMFWGLLKFSEKVMGRYGKGFVWVMEVWKRK